MDNVNYKKLYYHLFNLISQLRETVIETADESDETAKSFIIQLQYLQFLAEDKFLELTEET